MNKSTFLNILKDAYDGQIVKYDMLGIALDFLKENEETNKIKILKYIIDYEKMPEVRYIPWRKESKFNFYLYKRDFSPKYRLPRNFFSEIYCENAVLFAFAFEKLIWKVLCLYDLNVQLKT